MPINHIARQVPPTAWPAFQKRSLMVNRSQKVQRPPSNQQKHVGHHVSAQDPQIKVTHHYISDHLRSSPIISIFFGTSPITSILFHPIPSYSLFPNASESPRNWPFNLSPVWVPQWFPVVPSGSPPCMRKRWPTLLQHLMYLALLAKEGGGIGTGSESLQISSWVRVRTQGASRRDDFLVDSPSNLGTLAKAVNLPYIWFWE